MPSLMVLLRRGAPGFKESDMTNEEGFGNARPKGSVEIRGSPNVDVAEHSRRSCILYIEHLKEGNGSVFPRLCKGAG